MKDSEDIKNFAIVFMITMLVFTLCNTVLNYIILHNTQEEKTPVQMDFKDGSCFEIEKDREYKTELKASYGLSENLDSIEVFFYVDTLYAEFDDIFYTKISKFKAGEIIYYTHWGAIHELTIKKNDIINMVLSGNDKLIGDSSSSVFNVLTYEFIKAHCTRFNQDKKGN